MEEGGRRGEWVGATEERRTAARGRPQSPARTPDLVGWKAAIRDEAGACAGGSSSASSLRGADLRGDVAVHHGGSGDGGARGRVRGRARAAPAQPRGLAGEGAFASASLGGSRRPRPGRSLCGWAGGLPSHGRWGLVDSHRKAYNGLVSLLKSSPAVKSFTGTRHRISDLKEESECPCSAKSWLQPPSPSSC